MCLWCPSMTMLLQAQASEHETCTEAIPPFFGTHALHACMTVMPAQLVHDARRSVAGGLPLLTCPLPMCLRQQSVVGRLSLLAAQLSV